jgi:hypothetical protein
MVKNFLVVDLLEMTLMAPNQNNFKFDYWHLVFSLILVPQKSRLS